MAEEMRSELVGYCYRMIGAYAEAEDAVQDTMLRVWQGKDQIHNRSALRTWIYRIATNVCLDKLRNAKRRALPMDLSGAAASIAEPSENLPPFAWIGPIPDSSHDPAVLAMNKETIRLSFIALLQTLPPRQRAVLILNEVFRWSAMQTAEAMDMTVGAVNSALQRARATMKQARLRSDTLRVIDADVDQRLLTSYVEAFEQYDLDRLLSLFQESASLSMPPYVMWVLGKMDITSFYRATRSHCAGSRLVPVLANGYCPAYAQYVPAGNDGELVPWSIHVLEIQGGQIAHVHHFIDPQLVTRFGLPANLGLDR
ncbi:sigma-70 family RNA polymerase sigma factor [Paenibacillus hemerocallicola]|uniref:Sigma-70 family RNA polymerase sigma factor n=2 Tax=Paenibacillus hemerocallicola TaxID=1172614 RepID=A0A5C4T4V9_9BACL|nr:sigma-70 family RNA polymerase sigma factor [Paenibacillus hemerocallicola]TNJ64068.1 sigma-70 family RNA polymerase sigma factor [Paenibacillus hemerocallicola]